MAAERILVVDDEPHIVGLCVEVLLDLGYEVRGVGDGLQALACLEAEPFDLLLVDIKMPNIDGLALLARAHEHDPNLTAVVITGYATMARAIQAMQAGARGFVLKPFGVDELAMAVAQALDQRRKEQERLRLQAQVPVLEMSQALLTQGDVGSLAGRLLEVVACQAEALRAVIALREEEGESLQSVATFGMPDKVQAGRALPVGDVQQQLLLDDEPTVVESTVIAELGPGWAGISEGLEKPMLALVPLRTGQTEIGLLALAYDAEGRPAKALSSSQRNLLSIISRQLAIALDNARLYAREQERSAQLAEALDQQQELDRLKDEFMRNVSHELRTPLSMIMGYAELLETGVLGELPEAQREPLRIIVERSRVLNELIENITAIVENESREPRHDPVSLSEIVTVALNDFQVLAEQSKLTLSGEIAPDVPYVRGDVHHLRKAVENLIGNALKFTPPGGMVAVRLRNADGQALLEVRDTGIGIAAEHQARIFDRFYQVDGSIRRTYGGSGLGLALVKEIVQSHGGTIRVESEPGKGSSFTVQLPADADCTF
jgi:signal transduction histidine kinase